MSLFVRDQYIPNDSADLGDDLGINYDGILDVTADRMQINRQTRNYQVFKKLLRQAVHSAIVHFPELARLILKYYLETDSRPEFLPDIPGVNGTCSKAYRDAYEFVRVVTDNA